MSNKPHQKNRSASLYRHHRKRVIQRKLSLLRLWGNEYYCQPKNKGKLHKGKIHCSCGMCQTKTRKSGWKRSDQRNLDKLKHDMDFYQHGINERNTSRGDG